MFGKLSIEVRCVLICTQLSNILTTNERWEK
jgi:hypothetical protein